MHLMMLVFALCCAWCLRGNGFKPGEYWENRWQKALRAFLFPPLLLLSALISVLWMGPHGQMVLYWEGLLSYWLAAIVLGLFIIGWLSLAWQGRHIQQQVQSLSTMDCGGKTVRVLNIPNLYSAQVGFWQPEIVISQGLFDALDEAHLEAILLHEQAHAHYRDTFWFFWLGWLRQMTAWLPQTEDLWQELLALREIRADHWASERTDTLLIAEALLLVIQNSIFRSEAFSAAFCDITPPNRLVQRIDALLKEEESTLPPSLWNWTWSWLWMALLPFLMIPFHT